MRSGCDSAYHPSLDMSPARSRDKFCLSLDNAASGSASSRTAYRNRWSEAMPPKPALTFAALWDPQEGMVTFSGAELLESESSSEVPPHVSDDDAHCPQLIAVDRDTDEEATVGESNATPATLQDALDACAPSDSTEHTKAGQDSPRCFQTRASSTLDGLDVYSHDIQVTPTRSRSAQLSCMDLLDVESTFRTPCEFGRFQLRSNAMLDSCRSDSESDSSSRTRPVHLKSRFSTTTTSTSDYVDVADNVLQSVHISETTFVPEWPQANECVSPAGSWPYLPQRRGVLRKRQPWDGDVTPTGTTSAPCTPRKAVPPKPWMFSSPSSPSRSATVFSSSASALEEERRGRFPALHIDGLTTPTPTPTPATTPSKRARFKLRFACLARWTSRQTSPDSDGWVCIEVTPIISQRYVADLGND